MSDIDANVVLKRDEDDFNDHEICSNNNDITNCLITDTSSTSVNSNTVQSQANDDQFTVTMSEQVRLYQTTQSLLMASSMIARVGGTDTINPQDAHHNDGPQSSATTDTMQLQMAELIRMNSALHERLNEVTNDRNRLLYEVSNLHLELDRSEVKRPPDGSFPQKSVEAASPVHYGQTVQHTAPIMPKEAGGAVSGSAIYVQPHYIPSNPTMSYPTGNAHTVYPQQYPMCHQQQQQQQPQPHVYQTNIANVNTANMGDLSMYQYHHQYNHGQHQHHAVVIAGSGVGIGLGGTTSQSLQQNLHKKNSIRNNADILKRPRAQTAYELSQDLQEKQIELLERKYGGLCARNAAITIQRGFRHFMMVKKFASITAMAKAEKRLSRRLVASSVSGDDASERELYLDTSQQQQQPGSGHINQQQQQPRVTIMAGPPGASVTTQSVQTGVATRTPPTRSLSMRERRHVDGGTLPRSQSGASTVSINSASSSATLSSMAGSTTHPHVNLLHVTEGHYYAPYMNATGLGNWNNYQMITHDGSYASSLGSAGSGSNSILDNSLNTSWASVASGQSPHTPYYSAAQIYMRPKCSSGGSSTGSLTPVDRKKVPPEVPKRTSSITAQQQHQQHQQQQLQLQQQQQQQQQQLLMMRQTPPPSTSMIRCTNGLSKTADNGSLTSVQSSGSESSIASTERVVHGDHGSDRSSSPNTWKRGTTLNSSQQFVHAVVGVLNSAGSIPSPATVTTTGGSVLVANSGGNPTLIGDEHAISSHTSAAQYEQHEQQQQEQHQLHLSSATTVPSPNYKISETIRKRQYRVGLNLFNKKPEKGVAYLIRRGFLEQSPQAVARFLITRKGLSRQMIGEYLGNLQMQFNMAVLSCFALELDLAGMQVDVALRKFQTYFRMPGEAQKIERLMEIYSHRFCVCNPDIVARLRSSDTIFVLAFAIIMLNTDLHTPNLKPERRMRLDDFIKNLRGIDDCHDIDRDMLAGIYERVKANEFKPGSDHVTQVMKVQATIVGGKKPNLALPHRRLVCYCRLYEIPDVNKKERPGVHQREVFLFNDLLVITKILSKKKPSVTYTFRNSIPLCGIVVTLLDVPNYPCCIQLSQKVDNKTLITFNARNEHDRCKFADDLKESICEMDEMESLRIEAELDRQKSARNRTATTGTGNSNSGGASNSNGNIGASGAGDNRDSGVADVEVCASAYQAAGGITASGVLANMSDAHLGGGSLDSPSSSSSLSQQHLKRSALSNSLLDMHEQSVANEKAQRRGSVGSLDSGMSISFQSTTTSNASRDNAAVMAANTAAAAAAANAAGMNKMRFVISSGMVGMNPVYTQPPTGMQAYIQSANYMHHPNHPHHQFTHHQHPQANLVQYTAAQQEHLQQQAAQQQLKQQQQSLPQQQGRIRERKHSRPDENGRSTEV